MNPMTATEVQIRMDLYIKEKKPQVDAVLERMNRSFFSILRFTVYRQFARGWPVRDFISDEQPPQIEWAHK